MKIEEPGLEQPDEGPMNARPQQPRQSPQAAVPLVLLILLGVVLRVGFATSARPLWLDPAMLALNVTSRSAIGLLASLEMNQAAPPGILLALRAVYLAAGERVGAMVVVPLLAGGVALALTALAAWKSMRPTNAFLVTLPLAVGATGVYFAGEIKHYSSELLVSALVVLCAVCVPDVGEHDHRRFAPSVLFVAVFAPLFAFTAFLSLPVLLATMAGVAVKRRSKRPLDFVLPSVLLLYLVALYKLFTRSFGNTALVEYHRAGFPPSDFWKSIPWWAERAVGLFSYPLNVDPRLIIPVVLFLVGALAPERLARAGAWRLVAIGTLVATAIAAALHKYPFYTGTHDVNSRFVVQLVPPVLLLCGRGLDVVRNLDRRGIAWALAAIVWVAAVVSHRVTAREYIWQDVPAAVASIEHDRGPDDCVWVYSAAIPQTRIATLHEDFAFTPGVARGGAAAAAFRRDLRRLDQCDTAWLVVAHDYAGETRTILQAAHDLGFSTTVQRFRGAHVIRCDRSPSPR